MVHTALKEFDMFGNDIYRLRFPALAEQFY